MDPARLRAEFPVLERAAYLNAGTCGPLPAAAARAIGEALVQAVSEGRSRAYFDALADTREQLREAYAQLLGAAADDVALTTSTSEGIVRVLAALDLQPGDEVVTSDEEHPGLQVLLDGAQGVGAVPIDLAEGGCDFYAGSGQKWLCGPVGSGMLWVAPQWSDRLPARGPTYVN